MSEDSIGRLLTKSGFTQDVKERMAAGNWVKFIKLKEENRRSRTQSKSTRFAFLKRMLKRLLAAGEVTQEAKLRAEVVAELHTIERQIATRCRFAVRFAVLR